MNEVIEKAFPAQSDAIVNGAATGSGGQILLNADGDFRALRAYRSPVDNYERSWVDRLTRNSKGEFMEQPMMVANDATLRHEEWQQYDTAVQTAERDNLVGIADLEDRGLTRDIGEGLDTFMLMYEERTAQQNAQMDMTGESMGMAGDEQYAQKFLPIPIIYSHFRVNMRRLLASRKTGDPLDTVLAEEATQNCNEYKEDLLFTDQTYTYGGATIYTYLSHPNAITGSTSNWGDTAAMGVTDIYNDVIDMKQGQIDANHSTGPWALYIPQSIATRLDADYAVSGAGRISLRKRLEDIEGLEAIKVADRLPSNTVVLVQMKRSNVRLVRGMDLNPVQWNAPNGMAAYFQVMTIRVPQIRVDSDGNLGVTVYTW